jgi:hypothetical protein
MASAKTLLPISLPLPPADFAHKTVPSEAYFAINIS